MPRTLPFVSALWPSWRWKQPWDVKHKQKCERAFFIEALSPLNVCAHSIWYLPLSTTYQTSILTRLLLCHINTAHCTLSLQCKQVQCFDAVKPPHVWTSLVTTSLLATLSSLKGSMKPGYLCWQSPQPQVKPPHRTPFTSSSLWDVNSCILSFFWAFFDCNRLPRQHVGAPLGVFGGTLSCDPADNKPSDRHRWRACCSNHHDGDRVLLLD